MHVMLCYSIYPPIQAGGAELIVSYLAEGLAQRGHRVTVVSTCGPEMDPYPTEYRNGVEVIRFFPKNRYWLFDREGRRGLDKLESRVGPPVARDHEHQSAGYRPFAWCGGIFAGHMARGEVARNSRRSHCSRLLHDLPTRDAVDAPAGDLHDANLGLPRAQGVVFALRVGH
jgi:hypothetical protein